MIEREIINAAGIVALVVLWLLLKLEDRQNGK